MRIESTDTLFQVIRNRMRLESSKIHSKTNLDLRTLKRGGNQHSVQLKSIEKLMKPFKDSDKMLILPYQYEQEALSKKAMLALEDGECTNSVRQLIIEALAKTKSNENDYIDRPFLAFEPQLFHTLANTYAKDKNLPAAINILQNVLASAATYPPDERTHEVQITPILLALATYQMQIGDCESALTTCENGFEIAARRNQGRYCLDFLRVKIQIYIAQGNKEACCPLLAKTYAGYVAINNAEAANEILTIARKQLETNIETHRMETLLHNTLPEICAAKPLRNITDLGDMLKFYQSKISFSRKTIYAGICDSSALTKLEMNKTKSPNIFLIEALSQRMGKDIGLYNSFHAPARQFDSWQLRDKIWVLIRAAKFKQAGELLEEFKAMENEKRYQHIILRQFIQTIEAIIYGSKHSKENIMPEYLDMLTAAIKLTHPNFDERNIADYPFSVQEATIVNYIAAYYHLADDLLHAEKIYRGLLHNIETHWKDESVKSRLYCNVAFNLSSCLGLMNQRKRAIAVIDKALEYGIKRRDYKSILGLYYNKGCNLCEDERKEESLPYVVLAFYGFLMFYDHGRSRYADMVRTFISKNFGIEL